MSENYRCDSHRSVDWRKDLDGLNIGFVFAASGTKYTALAFQAADSVKALHPTVPIDLYTDQSVDDGAFDMVHQLEKSWFRPKFEAISRSRFDRTVYLDSDLVVVADVLDLFWVLDRYDMAAAHVQSRNASWATETWRTTLPNSFPQINSGVMAVKKNERTDYLMSQVEAVIREFDLKMDQAALRELIWLSDVSLYVLPSEYNVRGSKKIVGKIPTSSAPRILHSSKFHKRMQSNKATSPKEIYGLWTLKAVRYSISQDKQLTSNPDKPSFWNFLKS